ncbi:diacylglycerol kinase family protein [Aliihoeflea sp. 40Bstr573]|uniref:diacylglycerol/lipid kinase family protein n=1 Tax=Aliihoeflea sp. 40Bstr573 TaxID=2696467 RepID=UPI0035323575
MKTARNKGLTRPFSRRLNDAKGNAVHFKAILNSEGGTLRTADTDALSTEIQDKFSAGGHSADIVLVQGKDLEAELDRAVADNKIEGVLIGGGDGSVSGAAAKLMNTGKVLAVLPAGTMNLFARSLQVPLDLSQALDALARAPVSDVDIATANGRPFVHQYSVGMHAKLVHLREKREFASRLGKIRASAQAAVDTVLHPPRIRVRLEMPGGTEVDARTSSIGITNNLYGEGHIPYTDTPDGGTLGIYVTKARSRREMFAFLAKMALGKWVTNAQVEIHQTKSVTMHILSSHRRFRCVIDGELCKLEPKVEVKIHPGALKVLRPGIAEPK